MVKKPSELRCKFHYQLHMSGIRKGIQWKTVPHVGLGCRHLSSARIEKGLTRPLVIQWPWHVMFTSTLFKRFDVLILEKRHELLRTVYICCECTVCECMCACVCVCVSVCMCTYRRVHPLNMIPTVLIHWLILKFWRPSFILSTWLGQSDWSGQVQLADALRKASQLTVVLWVEHTAVTSPLLLCRAYWYMLAIKVDFFL